MKVLEVLSRLATLAGGLIGLALLLAAAADDSAPRQAALAAMACAATIIPYCAARTWRALRTLEFEDTVGKAAAALVPATAPKPTESPAVAAESKAA